MADQHRCRFFIYDHNVLKREEDDLKDAIIYFYPRTVSIDSQCALVGKLIGISDFFYHCFPKSPPKIIKLSAEKFATERHGDFTIALGFDLSVPDEYITHHFKFVWSVFVFFQGSLEAIRQRSKSRQSFPTDVAKIWDMYLPFCQIYGDLMSQAFRIIPDIQLPKRSQTTFLHASHILQRCHRHPGVLGGTLLYKGKVLCTQLSPDLTKRLLILKPQQSHLPCLEIKTDFELPGGLKLLKVFVPQKEYSKMSCRRQKSLKDRDELVRTISHTVETQLASYTPTYSLSDLSSVHCKTGDSSQMTSPLRDIVQKILEGEETTFDDQSESLNQSTQTSDNILKSKTNVLSDGGEATLPSQNVEVTVQSKTGEVTPNSYVKALPSASQEEMEEDDVRNVKDNQSSFMEEDVSSRNVSEGLSETKDVQLVGNIGDPIKNQAVEDGNVESKEMVLEHSDEYKSMTEENRNNSYTNTEVSSEDISDSKSKPELISGNKCDDPREDNKTSDVDPIPQDTKVSDSQALEDSNRNTSTDADCHGTTNDIEGVSHEYQTVIPLVHNNNKSSDVTRLDSISEEFGNTESSENQPEPDQTGPSAREVKDQDIESYDNKPSASEEVGQSGVQNLPDIVPQESKESDLGQSQDGCRDSGDHSDSAILDRSSENPSDLVTDSESKSSEEKNFVLSGGTMSSISDDVLSPYQETIHFSGRRESRDSSLEPSGWTVKTPSLSDVKGPSFQTSSESYISSLYSQSESDNMDTISGEGDDLIDLTLYLQGHSEMLLLLLLENGVKCDKDLVTGLWRSSLAHLAELDFEVKERLDSVKPKGQEPGNYSFLRHDSFNRNVAGNVCSSVTRASQEFIATSARIHNSFQQQDSLTDMLLRTHTSSVMGHKSMCHETFFQLNNYQRNTGGYHQASDDVFRLEQIASQRLEADYDITLL